MFELLTTDNGISSYLYDVLRKTHRHRDSGTAGDKGDYQAFFWVLIDLIIGLAKMKWLKLKRPTGGKDPLTGTDSNR